MIDSSPSGSVVEQARLELAVAASAAERRNKPTGLVVGAGVLVLVALVTCIWAFSSRTKAIAAAEESLRRLQDLQNVVDEITRESASLAARGTQADPLVGARLERLATEAGLKNVPAISDSNSPSLGGLGMQQKRYTLVLTNQDPAAILRFLKSTQNSPLTPGLEISRLSLRPGGPTADAQPGWNMTADFNRWEKTR